MASLSLLHMILLFLIPIWGLGCTSSFAPTTPDATLSKSESAKENQIPDQYIGKKTLSIHSEKDSATKIGIHSTEIQPNNKNSSESNEKFINIDEKKINYSNINSYIFSNNEKTPLMVAASKGDL